MTHPIQRSSINSAPKVPAAAIVAQQPTELSALLPSRPQQHRVQQHSQVDVVTMEKPPAKPKLSLISLPDDALGDVTIADGKMTSKGVFAYMDSDDLVSLASAHRFFREQYPALAELAVIKRKLDREIFKAHHNGGFLLPEGQNPGLEVYLLTRLVPKLHKLNFHNQAVKVIKDAKDIAHNSQSLLEIATAEANIGLYVDAETTANRLNSPMDKTRVLVHIKTEQAKVSLIADTLIAEAKAIANTINVFDYQAVARMDIATAQADIGLIGDALETVNTIYDPRHIAKALSNIATVQVKAGLVEEAKATFAHAIAFANTIDQHSPGNKVETLKYIATAQLKAVLMDEAEATFANAIAFANTINDPEFSIKDGLLHSIAKAQAEAGFVANALATANTIDTDHIKLETLSDIATVQAEVGFTADAKLTFQSAILIAKTNMDPVGANFYLLPIVRAQADVEFFAEAIETAKTMTNIYNHERDKALQYIAAKQNCLGFFFDSTIQIQTDMQIQETPSPLMKHIKRNQFFVSLFSVFLILRWLDSLGSKDRA
jgi:tetratricopeptide (TPR) repeat protein